MITKELISFNSIAKAHNISNREMKNTAGQSSCQPCDLRFDDGHPLHMEFDAPPSSSEMDNFAIQADTSKFDYDDPMHMEFDGQEFDEQSLTEFDEQSLTEFDEQSLTDELEDTLSQQDISKFNDVQFKYVTLSEIGEVKWTTLLLNNIFLQESMTIIEY